MKERWSTLSDVSTVSENNANTHWRVRHKRSLSQKKQIWALLNTERPSTNLPCHIHLSRLSPQRLDSDNLPSSMKYIRDAIADYFIPGFKPGRADGDDRLTWSYSQQKAKKKGVSITFLDP